LTTIQHTLQAAFAGAVQSMHRHPKRLAAAIAVALLSMGGGAFAIASIESNSNDVVVRAILEDLALPQLASCYAGRAFNSVSHHNNPYK
jgi:adenylosuccinate lyase